MNEQAEFAPVTRYRRHRAPDLNMIDGISGGRVALPFAVFESATNPSSGSLPPPNPIVQQNGDVFR